MLGVVLIVLGVGALQWLAVDQGWSDGPAAIDRIVDATDGSRVADWGLAVGIPMLVVGLWFLYVALKPRRRTHERVPADVDAWLTPSALTALASSAAREVPGVTEATSTLNRKTALTVRVVTEPDMTQEPILGEVRTQVAARLEELTSRTVHVRPGKARR